MVWASGERPKLGNQRIGNEGGRSAGPSPRREAQERVLGRSPRTIRQLCNNKKAALDGHGLSSFVYIDR